MEAQNLRTAEGLTTSQEKLQGCDEPGETDWVVLAAHKPQTAKGLGWGALRASHQRRLLHGGARWGTHSQATSANKQPRTRPRRPWEKLEPEPKGARRDKTGRNDTRKKGQDQGVNSRQKERGSPGLKAEDRARTRPVPCSRVTWVVYLLLRSDRHSRERRFPHIAATAAVKPDIHWVVPDCESGTG